MRLALRAGLTLAALFAMSTTASAQLPPIVGDYGLKGTGAGSKYAGKAVISKVGGEMYRATWTIGSRVFAGVCFREGQSLSCASCPSPESPTVISYLVGAKGLDGVVFVGSSTKIGKELMTPKGQRDATKEAPAAKGQMNPVTLAGEFDLKGTNPDNSAYAGTASVKQLFAVSPFAYQFDWKIGASIMHGSGVRDVTGSPIVAAQCSKKTESVALVYSIDASGKTLTGAWTQELSGTVTAGNEIMTKWK